MMNNHLLPAEWECEGAIMLAWPHAGTDWAYMLDEVRLCFSGIVKALAPWTKVIIVAPDISEPKKYLEQSGLSNIFYFRCPTNDTWTRDYGPITIDTPEGKKPIDFGFNGWGLKFAADRDNLVTSRMSKAGLLTVSPENRRNFILEGGGIESDGAGMLMTTSACQLSPNRNPTLSENEIKEYLCSAFGGKKAIMLHHGHLDGDDTDSHIDTIARFAPNNTIVYTGCDDRNDAHFSDFDAMEQELMAVRNLEGNPFNLLRLPLPDAIFDENGERLPATYANFLALPNAVIMPTYSQPRKDDLARQILMTVFDVPVITVDCRALIKQHGSLHCMTMQIPNEILAI